jgi:hypothetical protein
MKNVLVLIIVGLLFGCTKKGEVAKEDIAVQKPYVISEEDRKYREELKNGKIPSPFIPFGISGESNLLIDEHSNIYYYQRNKKVDLICDYGRENDTIPMFLDLQPKDLIKIPKDCIEKFINENVMNKEKRRQILIMESQTDTIKDKSFLRFLKNIQTPKYVIRRTTQEEDTVLYYKKKDLFYDSNVIKWDKSRIKFPKY